MSHFKGKVDTTWGAAYYQFIGATQAGIEEQSETELHPVSKCYVTCQNPTLTNSLRESARPQADSRSIPNGIEATVIQRPFLWPHQKRP